MPPRVLTSGPKPCVGNRHLPISLNTCSPPTQNTGNEIRETKTRDSYIAALNEAMIYSILKHSTWLVFQVFHVARSTCCCEQ